MEKTIKMSLETAQKWMGSVKNKTLNEGDANSIITDLILQNFTKEELEGKQGFTWEESFVPGYYIKEAEVNYPSALKKIKIDKACNTEPHVWFKNQYRTEKQALSALAFAQLSHIVYKYNESKPVNANSHWTIIWFVKERRLGIQIISPNEKMAHLEFLTQEDAITSLEVNKSLWEQYWMI